MNDVCIIGNGVVGKETAKVFGITKYYDLKGSNITLQEAAKCRFIFLCLPTPIKDGHYDTTAITDTVRQLNEYGCHGVIVLRSTVTPGTTRALQEQYNVPIVHNPEFLSEGSAEFDAKHPDFILLGSDIPSHAKAVRGLYEARFKGVDVYETDTVTSEMAKVALNAFFVTKVVFANGVYDLCQRSGANYEQLKKVLEKHKYGSKNHFQIWHKGGRGAGGRCLKKDFEAFATWANMDLPTLVQRLNRGLLEEYPKDGNSKD